MFAKFKSRAKQRLKSKELATRKSPGFRIKKLARMQNRIARKAPEQYANLRGIKREILNLHFDDAETNKVKESLLKLHFQALAKPEKVSVEKAQKKSPAPAKPIVMSEEQYTKLKLKKLVVIYSSVTAKGKPGLPHSQALPGRLAAREGDSKEVLVIEFDGVLGSIRESKKGWAELTCVKNLKGLFSRLKQYFHVAVVFRRRNLNGFYRKVLDFVKKVDHAVEVLAVVRSPLDRETARERSKVKLGKFPNPPRCSRKQLGAKKVTGEELFVDTREIENFFAASKKVAIVTALGKDLQKLSKGRERALWRA